MLNIGDVAATQGMTKAIYDQLQSVLEPDLAGLSDDKRNPIQENWKKMSYAIAKGVVEYITANMEITGIQTRGNINATVVGQTATQSGVTFTQSNDGTGRVK